MFYNGGACCPNQTSYYYPIGNCQNRNNYAIVLVLFILLVIIIGNRFAN